jgi:hypothetical protein
MEICEVRQGEVSTIELVCDERGNTFGGNASVQSELNLFFNETTEIYLLQINDATWPVRGSNKKNHTALTKLIERDSPRICWLANRFPKEGPAERVLIEVHEFIQRQNWPIAIDIGIDDKVVDEVRKKKGDLTGVPQVISWLSNQIIMPPAFGADLPRLLISGSPHAQGNSPQSAFRVHGAKVSADVQRDANDRLIVTRVVESRSSRPNHELRPIFVVQGGFKFCDITVASQFRGSDRTELDQIVSDAGSYLNIWKEYNRLERESVLRRVRNFGWLQYTSRRSTPKGWRFSLRESDNLNASLQLLQDSNEYLEVDTDIPPELQNVQLQQNEWEFGSSFGRRRTIGGFYIRSDIADRSIEITSDYDMDEEEPPETGYIYIGLTGDRTSLGRRDKAQAKIISGKCPMPQLGLLLEGKAVIERRRKTEKPLSPGVREAFGDKHAPTDRQVQALNIALNTPDIALIQGPPGTGKTKTIAALQVRLAEIAGEAEGVSGRTLLTSYQHSAVENAVAQTVVFGLPAVKVGRRRDQVGLESTRDIWRLEKAEAIKADLTAYPIKPVSNVFRQIQAWTIAYIRSPGNIESSIKMLGDIWDLSGAFIPQSLRDRLLEMKQVLERRKSGAPESLDEDRDLILKAVRALRVDPVAFSDDGPRNAYKVYGRLQGAGVLMPEEEELLNRATDWESVDVPDFLEDLHRLQESLLDRLMPDERPEGVPDINIDVEMLLNEICSVLYDRVRKSSDGVEAALVDYLDELENDIEGVRMALENYTTVLASTCQQVMGKHMEALKGEDASFETVVVDEAARANPLDLCIPMSMAERRIVLVGDHRQLPHILEPDIERELDHSISENTQVELRRSLFERLFNELKKREQRDGIKRTITLDTQYRMHPILGDFVSRVFYEPYGESFKSIRPAEDYVHGLDGYGEAVAAWKNIPIERGEERGGKSKSRVIEAQWIAQEVARLSKDRSDLSFGVISFYQAQVQEILKEMAKLELADQMDDQTLQVNASYTRNPEGRLVERLCVGTVDAFQGKEFDVVILSMTRSNRNPAGDEQSRRRKFGHLMLENRLCVAMSRQKRLFIVVGDDAMLASEEARQAVPGLVAFYELSESENGIVL